MNLSRPCLLGLWKRNWHLLSKVLHKMACPSILNPTAEFPWVTEFWNVGIHCTMDVACPSMSLGETYCVSKWLPQNRWILKRLAPSWLLFGGISMMLNCDLQIKLFIQKMVILMQCLCKFWNQSLLKWMVIYSEQITGLFKVRQTTGYDTNTDDLANI